MSEPDDGRPSSSDAPAEKAPARPAGEPAPGRWTLVPSTTPFEEKGFGKRGGSAESRQITIAELLLLTTIAAIVLGILRMVPGGFSERGALLGSVLGLIVLSRLRPRRAIIHVASWAILGLITAQASLRPDGAAMARPFSLIFVLYIIGWAFSRQCVAARRAWSLTARRLWWGFVAACVLCRVALTFGWTGVQLSWLPLLVLYGLATAAGVWRLVRWSAT